MDTTTLLGFCAVAFVTIATPGPTVLLALHNGSHHGFRGAVPGIAGAVLSDVLLIAATAAGLGALLLASEMAFRVLQWAGVAYLAWLGLALLRGARHRPGGSRQRRARRQRPAAFFAQPGRGAQQPQGPAVLCGAAAAVRGPGGAAAAAVRPAGGAVCRHRRGGDGGLRAAGCACHARRLGAGAARWLDRLGGGALLLLAAALAGYRRGAA